MRKLVLRHVKGMERVSVARLGNAPLVQVNAKICVRLECAGQPSRPASDLDHTAMCGHFSKVRQQPRAFGISLACRGDVANAVLCPPEIRG